jgi:hypothetical protein
MKAMNRLLEVARSSILTVIVLLIVEHRFLSALLDHHYESYPKAQLLGIDGDYNPIYDTITNCSGVYGCAIDECLIYNIPDIAFVAAKISDCSLFNDPSNYPYVSFRWISMILICWTIFANIILLSGFLFITKKYSVEPLKIRVIIATLFFFLVKILPVVQYTANLYIINQQSYSDHILNNPDLKITYYISVIHLLESIIITYRMMFVNN